MTVTPTRGAAATLRRLLGTACGVGRLPGAPGTWGSLAALAGLAGLIGVADRSRLGGGAAGLDLSGLVPAGWAGGVLAGSWPAGWPGGAAGLVLAAVAIAFLLGWWIGGRARGDHGRHDPPAFVLDEVVGQALAALPLVAGPSEAPTPLDPLGLLLAFVVFRVLDVAKPPPLRRLERLPGGLGIMADDLAAGAAAALVVALLA